MKLISLPPRTVSFFVKWSLSVLNWYHQAPWLLPSSNAFGRIPQIFRPLHVAIRPSMVSFLLTSMYSWSHPRDGQQLYPGLPLKFLLTTRFCPLHVPTFWLPVLSTVGPKAHCISSLPRCLRFDKHTPPQRFCYLEAVSSRCNEAAPPPRLPFCRHPFLVVWTQISIFFVTTRTHQERE